MLVHWIPVVIVVRVVEKMSVVRDNNIDRFVNGLDHSELAVFFRRIVVDRILDRCFLDNSELAVVSGLIMVVDRIVNWCIFDNSELAVVSG
jgi:hypothetical protein